MKLLVMLAFMPACASATTLSFDLENLGGSDQTEVVLTQGDFSITIASADNQPFRVGNTEAGGRATFANRSLLNRSGNAFRLTFSQPIEEFTAEFGDFGNDVDTGVLRVFLSGSFIDVDNETYFANRSLGNGDIGTLESFVPDITSIELDTTGDNSVLWDNFTVTFTPVPEPQALVLTGVAFGFLLRRRRVPARR